MTITNLPSQTAHRAALALNSRQVRSSERLSTGKRINRAGDDVAGLAVANKMRSQIRGLDQADRNSQDGISLIQTAEGALEEIHRILERVRILTNQASNDTYTESERKNILLEINQILEEIDQITQNTEFNTLKLLQGSKTLSIVGDEGSSEVTQQEIDAAYQYFLDNIGNRTAFFSDMDWIVHVKMRWLAEAAYIDRTPTNVNILTNQDIYRGILREYLEPRVIDTIPGVRFSDEFHNLFLGFASLNILNIATRPELSTYTDEYIWEFFEDRWEVTILGPFGNSGFAATLSQHLQSHNLFEFDPDLLQSRLSTPSINITLPLNLQVQSGANAMQRTTISLRDMSTDSLGLSNFTNDFLEYTLHIGEKEVAQDADGNWYTVWSTIGDGGRGLSRLLETVDEAINKVSRQRAELGAIQNRLEHTINNLAVAHENMSASNARISDTDMAQEFIQLAKLNILQQASIAMISQANATHYDAISLLIRY